MTSIINMLQYEDFELYNDLLQVISEIIVIKKVNIKIVIIISGI